MTRPEHLPSGAPVRDGVGGDDRSVDVVLSGEQLTTETVETGTVRARKHIDTEHVEQVVQRGTEHADMERTAAAEGDSGQVETLEDGSLSIPVFEEVLVVEKRMVVRERVVLRKRTVYEEQLVTADLRRERVEIDTTGDAVLPDEANRLKDMTERDTSRRDEGVAPR